MYNRRIPMCGTRIRLLPLVVLMWGLLLACGWIYSSSLGGLLLTATVLAVVGLRVAWGIGEFADSTPESFWQRIIAGSRIMVSIGFPFVAAGFMQALSTSNVPTARPPAVQQAKKSPANQGRSVAQPLQPRPVATLSPLRPVEAGDTIQRSCDINVLWMASTGNSEDAVSGGVSPIRIDFRRDSASAAPLKIGVVEELPTGAGPTLRAAIWQAAIVAALQRHDDMSGVELTIHLRGQMDGPSAGGILCLALLSLIDERTLPSDLAMTGTVLPDGTIGQVGGVPQKLHAAAARGCRRVIIPSFLRFHHDLATKTQVDVRKLATDLGLTLCPAESIEEAYRIVHGLAPSNTRRVDRLPEYLPGELEEWLKQSYADYLKSGDRIFEATSEEGRRELIGNGVLELRSHAESAYGTGKLLEARQAALVWSITMQSHDATRRSVIELDQSSQVRGQTDPEKFLPALEATVKRHVTQLPSELQLSKELAAKLPAQAAQLFVEIGAQARMEATGELLQWQLQRQLNSYGQTEGSTPGQSLDLRAVDILKHRVEELIQVHLVRLYMSHWSQDQQTIAQLLANGPEVRPRTQNIEQFFYAAALAAQETTRQEAEQLAVALSLTPAAIETALRQRDPEFTAQDTLRRLGDHLHQQLSTLEENSSQRRFLDVLNAQVFAHRIAEAAGTRVRWTELAARYSETAGAIEYGRPEVLSFMLRRARDSALQNLTRCLDAQIPCTEAIRLFESAECQRDDLAVDKVSVLVSYWKASLQAQALRMMFGESNEP